MSFFRVKIYKEDSLFSLYIRRRDKWTCQRCGRKHEEGSKSLGNSHFWGRAAWNTRFDPENCDALCNMPCHSEWEHEKGVTKGFVSGVGEVEIPRDYRAWKIKHLGQERFDALVVRAHTTVKKDRFLAKIMIELLIKEQEGRP